MRYAEAGSLRDATRVGAEAAKMAESDGHGLASWHWVAVGQWYEIAGDLPQALAALVRASKTDDLELRAEMLREGDRIRANILAHDPTWLESE